MNVNTVIFDLDGTLIDTLGDLTDAVNAALAAQGLAPASEEQIRQRVGNGVGKLLERSLPQGANAAALDAALSTFRTYYEAHMTCRTRPYDGITAALDSLRRAGVKIAVLSNKYDGAAKALTAHYFPGVIDLTLGERPQVARKPDPAACHEILRTLGAEAATTAYVGDSDVDMRTAKNAGLTAIGVTWGFRSGAALTEAGADFLAENTQQLMALLGH